MSRVKPEDVQNPGQSIKQLRQYLMAHRPPATEHFTEMVQLAQKLRNDKLLEQCKVRIRSISRSRVTNFFRTHGTSRVRDREPATCSYFS